MNKKERNERKEGGEKTENRNDASDMDVKKPKYTKSRNEMENKSWNPLGHVIWRGGRQAGSCRWPML